MRCIDIILKGFGQVLFQNNRYSGLLFLLGIFYNSWLLGLAALLGTIISTITAQILKFSKEDIENGLYGLNGTLTGIGIFCFFEFNAYSSLALFVGAVLSTLLMHLIKRIIPPFTAPFVLVTWLMMSVLLFLFKFPFLASSPSTENTFDLFQAASRGFGQVMFQDNTLTGLLFLIGIAINNQLMAIYALYGAILGAFVGYVWFVPISNINAGLSGYNAILCALAFTGSKKSDFVWITVSILLSTSLQIAVSYTGIVALTAPFVLATWIVLKLKLIQLK